MALLHKSIVVGVPTRPTVNGGVGRPQVSGGVPAPHGIRKPQPASGVGVLEADVQINNRTPNSTEGSLVGAIVVVIGEVAFTSVSELAAPVFERAYQPVDFAGSGEIVSTGVALFDRFSYLNSQGSTDGDAHAEYQFSSEDSGAGSLDAVVEAKYAAFPTTAAAGTLTVATSAEGAIYSTDASVSGTGALAASVGVADDAQLAGDGVFGLLEADFGTAHTAQLSASTGLSVAAFAQFAATASGFGSGELNVLARGKFSPSMSGGGTFTPAAKPKLDGAGSGGGALTASAFERTFTNMQMNKTANQSISGTYARITSMTADAAYPGTIINSNALVMSGGSSNATIEVHGVGTKSSTPYSVYFQVLVNGVMVGTEQVKTGSPNSFTLDFTFTGVALNDGDVVELQARRSGTASILSGTYLRVTA